jgi:hypothetical protein
MTHVVAATVLVFAVAVSGLFERSAYGTEEGEDLPRRHHTADWRATVRQVAAAVLERQRGRTEPQNHSEALRPCVSFRACLREAHTTLEPSAAATGGVDDAHVSARSPSRPTRVGHRRRAPTRPVRNPSSEARWCPYVHRATSARYWCFPERSHLVLDRPGHCRPDGTMSARAMAHTR